MNGTVLIASPLSITTCAYCLNDSQSTVLAQDIWRIMVLGCVLREKRDIGHSLKQASAGASSCKYALVAQFDSVPYVVGYYTTASRLC
jgi:hypothetical protein